MHRSNILLVLILVVAIMSTLSSCGKSDISDSHDIISNLLISEDVGIHKSRLLDVETPYTLCYKNIDESVSVYIFSSPISYKNGNGDLELIDVSLVLSSIFRKNVSAKMKFCAGKSGEGAAKPRLFAL